MREAFAMQKLLRFFSTKNIGIFQILTFEILTTSLVLNNRAQLFTFAEKHYRGNTKSDLSISSVYGNITNFLT